VHRVDVRPEQASPRCLSSDVTAADVVVAALALLNGDTQQTAEPLVELLEQHGIAWAWQLRRLTAGELSALAIDEAGWNMGELLALREAIAAARSPCGTQVDDTVTTDGPELTSLPPFLRSALFLPKSVSKVDLREFRGHKIGISALLGWLQAMPADEAKAVLQTSGEFMANICAIMLFAVWQMRSSEAATAADGASYADLAQIQNFCVSLSAMMLFLGLGGHMTTSSNANLRPAAGIWTDDEFLQRYAKHWAYSMTLYILGSTLLCACIVMDAWISLKFGYACAVSSLFVMMFLHMSSLDGPLFRAAIPLGLFHAPAWVRSMFGAQLDEKLLHAAKQQHATALELRARVDARGGV
jgi:hypothetical protein